MIARSYPTLSPDHRTRAVFDRIFDKLDEIERKPNGNRPLSETDLESLARKLVSSPGAVRLIGAFAQPLIGESGDPLLGSLAQAPGTGTVTNVSAVNTVSGLAISVTNPTTTPQISLSGTPNIAASNITSGVLPVARGGTNTGTPTGTYTPSLTNVANLDGSTAYQCQWLRIDDIVIVSGKVDVDPTLTATGTQLGISLPVASNLGAQEDCAGVAFASGIAGQGAAIRGDAANNRAEMTWVSTDVTNQPMYFCFAYQII